MSDESMQKLICPQCRNILLTNYKFCPECGFEILSKSGHNEISQFDDEKYFMYVCFNCKKVYKVKGKNKRARCKTCNDSVLIDIQKSYETWMSYDPTQKQEIIERIIEQKNNKSESLKESLVDTNCNSSDGKKKAKRILDCISNRGLDAIAQIINTSNTLDNLIEESQYEEVKEYGANKMKICEDYPYVRSAIICAEMHELWDKDSKLYFAPISSMMFELASAMKNDYTTFLDAYDLVIESLPFIEQNKVYRNSFPVRKAIYIVEQLSIFIGVEEFAKIWSVVTGLFGDINVNSLRNSSEALHISEDINVCIRLLNSYFYLGLNGENEERIRKVLPLYESFYNSAKHFYIDMYMSAKGLPKMFSETSMDNDYISEINCKQITADNSCKSSVQHALDLYNLTYRISDVTEAGGFINYRLQAAGSSATISHLQARLGDLNIATGENLEIIQNNNGLFLRSRSGKRQFYNYFDYSGYIDAKNQDIPFIVGFSSDGEIVLDNLDNARHILVAGTTGSGKSVFLHNLIYTFICNENTSVYLVDCKRVEFSVYEKFCLVTSEVFGEVSAGRITVHFLQEIDNRYSEMKELGVNNFGDYRRLKPDAKRLILVIDELSDLISDKETKSILVPRLLRIAQIGRAAGVHLILATQRPDSKVVDGTLKGNIPTRIAFNCISNTDSRVILDRGGAEKLTGNGDGLYLRNGSLDVERIQAPYISIDEIKRINHL